ncbi:MAG: hypothetical protein U1F43_06285 [Myxococcota bacterium]
MKTSPLRTRLFSLCLPLFLADAAPCGGAGRRPSPPPPAESAPAPAAPDAAP